MSRRTVFISYNKKDKEIAKNIAMFLVADNINVWFDEWEILAGDSIIEKINSGLVDCTHFIILNSENSAKSNWVRRELSSILVKAIEVGNPRIIPIRLDDTALPPLISDLHYIKYHSGTEEDRNNIVESISGQKPSIDYIKAIVRKYQEVIYDDDAGYPFSYKACPSCGSQRLQGSSFCDHQHDEMYYTIKCEECGWADWSN